MENYHNDNGVVCGREISNVCNLLRENKTSTWAGSVREEICYLLPPARILFEHALDENLWEQAVKTVQALPNDSSNELLIAALLRNVGKPFVGKTAQGGEDKHPTRSYVILLNELFPHWNSVGIEVNKDFEHVILSLVLHHDDIVHNYDSVCNSCRAIGDSHVSDFLNLKIAALSMIVDNNSFLVSQRELCVSLLERMNLRDSNPKVTQYQ